MTVLGLHDDELEEGDGDRCRDCDEPIEIDRLTADPSTERCLVCHVRHEAKIDRALRNARNDPEGRHRLS